LEIRYGRAEIVRERYKGSGRNAGRGYLLQMSIQLFDVILLIEHRGHIVVLQLVVRRLAGYVIAVAQIKREINHALLTVEIFLLSQHATIDLVITSLAQVQRWRARARQVNQRH